MSDKSSKSEASEDLGENQAKAMKEASKVTDNPETAAILATELQLHAQEEAQRGNSEQG